MKNKKVTDGKKLNDILFYAVMSAFPLIHFCVFYIGLNFNSVLNMFRVYDAFGNYTWSLTDSFVKTFQIIVDDSVMKYALINSVIGYFTVSIFGSVLSVLLSYYVYKGAPSAGFFKVMLFLPQIISAMVMAALFSYLVNDIYPVIVDNLFGFKPEGLMNKAQSRFATILFYCVWVNFGSSILLYLGAMQNIPDSVVEAAELDGAIGFKEFVYITFPSIYPTITTFVVVGIVSIFVDQFHVYTFYGEFADPQIFTIGYYLLSKVTKAGKSMVEYPMLSTMGNIMTLIAVPLTLGVKYLMERFGPTTEERKNAKEQNS